MFTPNPIRGPAKSEREAYRRLCTHRKRGAIGMWILALGFIAFGLANSRFEVSRTGVVIALALLGLAVWNTFRWRRLVEAGRYTALDVHALRISLLIVVVMPLVLVVIGAVPPGALLVLVPYVVLTYFLGEPVWEFLRSCLAFLDKNHEGR